MFETLRRDMFNLPDNSSFPTGYVVLRKTPPVCENLFLEQVLILKSGTPSRRHAQVAGTFVDSELYDSIDDGDIGLFTGRGFLRVVLTKRSSHNTLLVTERCDNRCLFCSQPPKERDDDWLLVQAAMALAAFNSSSQVGISGGEPLLYQKSFVRFLNVIEEHTPETPLHILSNGRSFSDANFTREIADCCQTLSFTFGIPLYSAVGERHDYLVGGRGAFRDTLRGLINAGNSGIPIELRFIPTKHNFHEIGAIVLLASRCLSNITQVSIMNLEPMGWAKRNWGDLYVDPAEYAEEIRNAVEIAERACLPIYLFNYPLCHIPSELHSYAVKSISDWKNYYPSECEGCKLRKQCGGYFASSHGQLHQNSRRIV